MAKEEKRAAEAIPNDTLVPGKPKMEQTTMGQLANLIKIVGKTMGIGQKHDELYGQTPEHGISVRVDVCPTCWVAFVQVVKALVFFGIVALFCLVFTGNACRLPYQTCPS